jgi:hypothetical protein
MNMEINKLGKRQIVEILKLVTGNGGDYARTSIDEYRKSLKALNKSQPSEVANAYNKLMAAHGASDPRDELIMQLAKSLGECAFVVETVAHLQGKERELLPISERARALLVHVKDM